MSIKNLKKVLYSVSIASLSLTSLIACGSNTSTNLQVEQVSPVSYNSYSVQTNALAQYKFGMKIDSRTPKVIFDVNDIPTNGIGKKVDLREFCSPVADQGHLGSCTAFAIVKGLREYLLNRDHKPAVALSPLFLYYNERKMDGDINDDAGSTLTTGMNVLKQIGTSTEDAWPYDVTKFKVAPAPEASTMASQFEVPLTKHLNGLKAIKAELDKQNPVVFGIKVYESFMKSKDGIIPVPAPNEKLLGGHAVSCFGYDDEKKVLIMRNSWSAAWGDKGYFYLPYDYFKGGLVADAWSASTSQSQTKAR